MLHKSIAAALVATIFSSVALAQPITESDATNIMDNYRSSFNALSVNLCLDRNKQSFTGKALQQAFTVKQNEVVRLLNRGDRTMAAGKASTMLDAFGHCYGKSIQQIDREIYASFMGGFMATEALAYGEGDKMQKAITLLDYAKSHGQENLQFLNLVKEHRVTEVKTVTSDSLDIGSLRSEAQANLARFKRDYEDKPVRITGIVSGTGERDWPKKSVWINLNNGVPNQSTSCKLSEDQFDKVYDVNNGQSITVEGRVKTVEAIASGNGFYLKSCKVI